MKAVVKPLAATLGAQVVVGVCALTPPVLAVVAAPDLGIAPADVGAFTTILFLTAMFSALAAGPVVERFGAIRVTQACLLCAAAGMALTATASLPLAALGGMVVGLGYGPMTPGSTHMLARVTTPASRPFVFSFKQTSVPIGGALAGLLLPALHGALGWRGAALAVALLGVATALALQPLRGALDSDRRAGPISLAGSLAGPLLTVVRTPVLRQLGLVSLSFSAAQICLGTYLVVYLVGEVGYGLVEAGLTLAVAQGAGITGRLAWGAIADRLVTARRLLAWLGFAMAAAAGVTALITGHWPVAAITAIAAAFGATAVGWNGIYLAEVVRVTSPERSANATGGVLFFTFAGMTVGPAVFGAIASAGGDLRMAFWVLAAICLLPGLALLRRAPETGG
ncbi:MAG: MFS transporter [Rhodospirillales bacterium]|nr:MFS transporter [Rhodospirillales bacterium]MDP6774509.1 MFS transporter [Rhodospirillales bacterium]